MNVNGVPFLHHSIQQTWWEPYIHSYTYIKQPNDASERMKTPFLVS